MLCNFIKKNKEVCKNNAVTGDTLCYWHSSKISEDEKNEQRSKGGKSKILKISDNFQEYELQTLSDIMKLNAVLINSALQKKIDVRFLTSFAYNLSLQMKLITVSDIEKRMEIIENKILNTDYELSE